jgi:hypothetical protein
MKKTVLFALITMFGFYYAPHVAAADTTTTDKTPGVGYVLLRGVSNVGLGVLAVPEHIVYQNAQIPVLGIITGTVCGAVVFVWREFAGVIDLVSFGFAGQGLYFAGMADFPWEGPWLPPEYSK